jgi:hypothetical protein
MYEAGVDPRILNLPKQMGVKKASEPNVLHPKRMEQLRKSNSQPTLMTRKSTDPTIRTGRTKNKKEETGFLDRAFANAASVMFEESDPTDARPNSSGSSDGEATKRDV